MAADEPMFLSRRPDALPLYEELRDKPLTECPDITLKVQKSLITFKAQYSFAFVSLRRMKSCPEVFFYPVLRPFPPNGFTPHCDGRGALSGPPDPPCRRIGGGTTGYGADGLAAGNPRFCIGKVRRKRG